MIPYGLLHPLSSVRFEEKIQFSASQDLSLARSKWFTLPETENRGDVWSIKPPDFSLKLYSHKRKDSPKFITSYRPPDALESELMYVKRGKYPTRPFKNHKPHNFRPLDEDLPDVVTAYERDPGNLNLKLRHLDIMRTTRSESDFSSRDTKTRMNTYKPAEPRWDARLMLPHRPWPPKSASYTRHRRRRGAYSAFLDRVEEKLSKSWKNRS
ncbi:uncharacterized protein si:dkey-30e9.6 [Thunnus maccoyii]|uniref:uncharacterized protein si:dkey-30e9.6 n=1 Tax=Thunnus maccoyii TaxID=8240 RepID=UPI001C4BD19D|nr:uncharacterized protein si:dkey-30e9.6 [Thunnus maccoyii]